MRALKTDRVLFQVTAAMVLLLGAIDARAEDCKRYITRPSTDPGAREYVEVTRSPTDHGDDERVIHFFATDGSIHLTASGAGDQSRANETAYNLAHPRRGTTRADGITPVEVYVIDPNEGNAWVTQYEFNGQLHTTERAALDAIESTKRIENFRPRLNGRFGLP